MGLGEEKNLSDLWISISELRAQRVVCLAHMRYMTQQMHGKLEKVTSRRNAVKGVRALVGGMSPLHQS